MNEVLRQLAADVDEPTTASYGWKIDTDLLADPGDEPGTNLNAVGVKGPSNIDPALEAKLDAGEGFRFRIYDDDGELYYEGRFVTTDEMEPKAVRSEHFRLPICGGVVPESAFGPLHDFGSPNAGATEIRYQAGRNGGWASL